MCIISTCGGQLHFARPEQDITCNQHLQGFLPGGEILQTFNPWAQNPGIRTSGSWCSIFLGGVSKQEAIRLADSAKCEVYVCFEGPLGAHLKSQVREKIWKGDYVEIFSLLPLEKFNLYWVKPEEHKLEDEEKRWYRLTPQTFPNWLQAFAIMASVIGEKNLENCLALFCYLDAVGEAYRVYGGTAWLRYDKQFCQRRAISPSLRWDNKDISLWMQLMTSARALNLFFQEGAGQSAAKKKGVCWQYNEGSCKFGGLADTSMNAPTARCPSLVPMLQAVEGSCR